MANTMSGSSAQDLVQGLKKLTSLTQNLEPEVSRIQNGSSDVPYQPILNGVENICGVGESVLSGLNQASPFSASEAPVVAEEFNTLAKAQQELLHTIMGKSNIAQSSNFLDPVASRLSALESILDTLSFGIVEKAPGARDVIADSSSKLSGAFSQAVQAYTPSEL